MSEKSVGSLTQGPILPVLTRLAVPIMAASFLSTAYSITDMAWVGMLGSKAVAGIGVGGMYAWLSNGLSTLARMGGQVHVGQALGRGEVEEARQYTAAALQLTTLFGILFGAVCLLLPEWLLSFFLLEDAVTKQYAKVYLMIACGASLLPFLNQTMTGLYTAQGDSTTPLKANAVGLVMNMVLDPVLILGLGPFPRMEAAGAAVATVSAQGVVTVILIGMMKRDNLMRQAGIFRLARGYYFDRVVRMGGPVALQSTLYCAISMVLTRQVSLFGEAAVAVQRVGGQIESLTWNMGDGFGAAMNAFAAQNYGANRPDRLHKGYNISVIAVAAWGAIVGAAFLLFPAGISGLFFHEAELIPLSVDYFLILGICEPFMCVELLAIGALSGLGRTKLCSAISIVVTGLRIPLALGLSATGLGLNGIWWALTLTSVAKGILLHFLYLRTVRNLN